MNSPFLHTLFIQTLAGSALLLVFLALRALFLKKMKASMLMFAWLLVGLRFLLPLSVPSPYIAPSVFPVQAAPMQVQPMQVQPLGDSQPLAPETSAERIAPAAVPSSDTAAPVPPSAPQAPSGLPLEGVWLLGAIAALAAMLIMNRHWRQSVMQTAVLFQGDSPIPVYLSNVASPCLAGLLRPVVFINPIGALEENLPHVLAHELSHYRHRDNWYRCLSLLLCAVFWFNPLVWFAAALYKRDCERACDERVTRNYSPEGTQSYARTLIALVTQKKIGPLALPMPMAASFSDMKKRIGHIVSDAKPKRIVAFLFTFILLCTSLLSFATGEAAKPAENTLPVPQAFSEMPAFCPSEYGLLLGFNGHLYIEKAEGRLTELAAVEKPALIACNTAFIFVYDEATHSILSFTFDGAPAEQIALKADIRPQQMAAVSTLLAIAAGADMQLYFTDMQSLNMCMPQIQNIRHLRADGKGSLVVSTADEGYDSEQSLTLYHTDPLETLHNRPRNLLNRVQPETDPATGETYPLIVWLDEITTSVSYGLENPMRHGAFVYGYNAQTRGMEKITVGNPNQPVITFVSRDHYMPEEKIKGWFKENHPDTQLRIIQIFAGDFIESVVGGRFPFDMIIESTGILQLYARQGIYKAFEDIPALAELSLGNDALYQEMSSFNKKLYAYPATGGTKNQFALYTALAQKIGFTMPEEGYTWRDLYDAAKAAGIGQEGTPQLFRDEYARPEFMYQYGLANFQWNGWVGAVDFDTPDFREMLDVYRLMVQDNMIFFGSAPNNNLLLTRNDYSGGMSSNVYAMPSFQGHSVSISQGWGYAVSANTLNEATCADFISNYLAPPNRSSASLPFTETANQGNSDYISWSYDFSPASLMEGTKELHDYIEGEMSEDEFIAFLQKRSREIAATLE